MKSNVIQVAFFVIAILLSNSCMNETQDGQLEKLAMKAWSTIPGDPNFSVADRLAIKDVMYAYSLYWDNGDIENFSKLFTDDAVSVVSREGEKEVLIPLSGQKDKAKERLDFFKSEGLQRRHLMANTHFKMQNDSLAYIEQYTLLTSTQNKKNLNTISTIVYDVWLKKIGGIWKIYKYKITLDGKLDN